MSKFVLCHAMPYEGYTVLGLYSTLQKAKEYASLYVDEHKLLEREALTVFELHEDKRAEYCGVDGVDIAKNDNW